MSDSTELSAQRYVNHHPGHSAYVSLTKRRCCECGAVKDLACYAKINSRTLTLRCVACIERLDAEHREQSARQAFLDAIRNSEKKSFARTQAPASRQSAEAFFWRLHNKAAVEGEVTGEQVFGRIMADFVHRILTEPLDETGKPISNFLRLKAFAMVQRQMSELLRHDTQQVDLSHLTPEELRHLLTPFMLDWFRENPDQFKALLNDMSHEFNLLTVEAGRED